MVTMRFRATVSWRHFNTIRNAVIGLNVRGEKMQVTEGRGWLTRPFWFTGNVHATVAMQCLLHHLGAEFE